ncbi:MAG: carboxypeptidase-like regulatory domain-containing protein, partial [Sediminibacterium sp.]
MIAFFCDNLYGQTLQGKILDEKTLQPITSATIFLSYTKVITTSLSDGNFTFPQFPSGRYELIVNCSGYKT